MLGSGKNLGYRSMQERLCLSHYVIIDRESVWLMLKFIDPQGVHDGQKKALDVASIGLKDPITSITLMVGTS